MKFNKKILTLVLAEADHHLLSDLQFAEAFHNFLKKEMDIIDYLSAEFGFKKFLIDYGVGRTLKGGDEAKLKILKLIQKFPFEKDHLHNITSLANTIKQKNLSSNSGSGGPGLPQSFCSKLMYVYRPDEVIPYDSYALKSLQLWAGKSLKDLDQYYAHANHFRLTHFHETSSVVREMTDSMDTTIRSRFSALRIDPVKMFSWKLTDKYLWCEEWDRRNKSG